jgi:hypothetical protein
MTLCRDLIATLQSHLAQRGQRFDVAWALAERHVKVLLGLFGLAGTPCRCTALQQDARIGRRHYARRGRCSRRRFGRGRDCWLRTGFTRRLSHGFAKLSSHKGLEQGQ